MIGNAFFCEKFDKYAQLFLKVYFNSLVNMNK